MAKNNNLTFRNIHISGFDCRAKKGSNPHLVINMSAELTKPVIEALEWEIGNANSQKMPGELYANTVIITPTDSSLKKHETNLECRSVSDFSVVAMNDKDGKVTHHEIRFQVISNQEGAAGAMESYWWACGGAKAAMKVSYSKEPVQQSLPVDEEGEGEGEPAEAIA